MPGIFEIQSTHYEGETIRTMARVVDLDQVMLTPDSADALTVKIQSRGVVEYERELPGGTGIYSIPQTPDAWTKSGSINFVYDWRPSTLAAESPSFRFRGGRSYTLTYDFDTEAHGHILGRHTVRILPSP